VLRVSRGEKAAGEQLTRRARRALPAKRASLAREDVPEPETRNVCSARRARKGPTKQEAVTKVKIPFAQHAETVLEDNS